MEEKYLLIGNAVKYSISPLVHNTFFRESGYINKFYTTQLVESLNQDVINSFFIDKIQGINVTIPYKQNIIKYLVEVEENAFNIGAVNTLKYTQNGYVGYNTDIYGMEDTLLENNIEINNKNILIIGAGGSGHTACFMALKNGVASITIANRTIENAIALKEHIKLFYNKDINVVSLEDVSNLKNIDIVLNTTSVGFGVNKESCPIGDELFKKNNLQFVFDIIYTPLQTKLLKISKEYGVKCTNGFSMLIYQALKAQEIWLEKDIDMEYKIHLRDKIFEEFYS